MAEGEILLVPFFGQGHLFPFMELCKHLASSNCKTTLAIPSHLSSSIPASLRQLPLVEIAEMPASPPPPPPSAPGSGGLFHHHHQQTAANLENLLRARVGSGVSSPFVCAILDPMMDWSAEAFLKFHVPIVFFNTSGACSAAMELATWQAGLDGPSLRPGELRLFPGLPDEMGLTDSDLKRRPAGPPVSPPREGKGPPEMFGPPAPGQKPPWMGAAEGSEALLINTCDDLEGPFLEYLEKQIGKKVWGVGPLLSEQYWRSAGSLVRDSGFRPNRRSNRTEEEVIEWLQSKQHGSVIYVSFGSEVGPTVEEYGQLAQALGECDRPFIWVIQPGAGLQRPPPALVGAPATSPEEEGFYPHGLEERVGNRGLVIRGWAPQLLILSHHSTGGFLSHCGWNSTVEAIGRGVPFLAWPIRGDQHYIAKLVSSHLRVGFTVATDMAEGVRKERILKGIERLMGDEELKRRSENWRAKFRHGFPRSSAASLDAFAELLKRNYS